MMEVKTSQFPPAHNKDEYICSEENADSTTRHLELENLAAEAAARLRDALSAINNAIDGSEPGTPPRRVLGSPFHPRSGRVRSPREQDSSDDEGFEAAESSDEEFIVVTPPSFEDESMITTPGALPKTPTSKRERPPSAKHSGINTPWSSSAAGRYGVNKPKCPPCARLKKKDPCNGQAPCRQCWGKGRRTPEECQEWGDNYVPKIRKKRAPRGTYSGRKNA